MHTSVAEHTSGALGHGGRAGSGGGGRYDLVGVICHRGRTAGGGHSVADVRAGGEAGGWRHVDDSDVTEIPAGDGPGRKCAAKTCREHGVRGALGELESEVLVWAWRWWAWRFSPGGTSALVE